MNATPIRICLIATPEVDASALSGLHGVFKSFAGMVPDSIEFDPVVVVPDSVETSSLEGSGNLTNVMGMPLPMNLRISEVDRTDILIIPSLYLNPSDWPPNPYPDLTAWLTRMYHQGALLCSACTGAMLLAETGLLDSYEATQHWAFEHLFRQRFPSVRLNINKVLLATGRDHRIIMSGASAAWHDLAIYLVARYATPQAAQVIAKFFLLTPHLYGQSPYTMFHARTDHCDSVVQNAQGWLGGHLEQAHPVAAMQQRSGSSVRTFNRRFQQATGLAPLRYVQQLRIDKAKQLLESSGDPVEEVGLRVGYEDPRFFRQLFKRQTGMTPGTYRRQFSVPAGR